MDVMLLYSFPSFNDLMTILGPILYFTWIISIVVEILTHSYSGYVLEPTWLMKPIWILTVIFLPIIGAFLYNRIVLRTWSNNPTQMTKIAKRKE